MPLGNRHDRCGDPSRRQPAARGWLLSAALWALLFAGVHIAWAAGSRVAVVDTAAADTAFDQVWFRLYNAVVAGGSFIAATVAFLTAVRTWRIWERWLVGMLWLVGGLLLLRGAIGLLQLGWSVISGTRGDPLLTWAVDGYMLAGGGLFLMAATQTVPRVGHARSATKIAPE